MGHTIIAEIITILLIFTTYTAKSQSTEDTTIETTDSITTEQIYTTIERTDVVTELLITTATIEMTDGPATTESIVTNVHPGVSTITIGGSAPAENSDTSTSVTPPPGGVSSASTVAPPADSSSYTSIVGGLPADTSYTSTVSVLPGVSPNTSTVAPPEVTSNTNSVAPPGVTPNTSSVAPPADNSYSSTVGAPGVTPNTSTVVPPVDTTSYTSTVAPPGVTPNTSTVALPVVSSNTSSIVQSTTPGPSGLPTFNTVTLQGPYVINHQWIEFYCNFSSNVTDPTARFLATFLSETQPLYNTSGTSRSFTLHEMYLAGKLGTSISCKVQSFWSNNVQTLSIPQASSNYFIGIERPQTDYSVSEADWNPDIVRIKSTLPITCDSGVSTNCNLPFRLTTTSDIVLQKQGSDGCNHAFKELDWKPIEQRAYSNDTTAAVFAKKDLFVTGPRYNLLSIRFSVPPYKTVNGVTYPNIWYNYVADIPIYHHDDSRAVCSSSGDPHLFTFDNVYYSTYSSGQFVYIQNKVGSPFQVHVRHWPCFYLVACICGVAVREGSTILGVDMCTDGIPHYFTYTRGALPTGFSLMKSRNGDYFEITVPSGNKISGNIWNPVISIQVYVTSDARGSLEGMCGSFDDIRNNDITNKGSSSSHDISSWDWSAQGPSNFLESWRIPARRSLFDGFLPSTSNGNNGPSRVEYCQCSAQTSNCGSNVANQDNTPNSQLYPAQPKVPFKSAGGARRKRATADDTTDYDYSYNTNAYNLTTLNSSTENWSFSWPTPSGITNVTAYENCYSVLWGNSPLRTACNGSISSSDVDEFVQKCMQDVQISDSLDQAKDKIPELQNRCIYNSLSTNNSDQPAANTSTLIQNVLTVVNQITAVACIPVDCNSHGTCVNGSCNCSPDYIGSDCAIYKNAVPRLLKSIDPSLCDAHSSSCSSITMMTANVTSLPSLACQVVVQKLNNVPATTYTTTATILSRDATSCALPAEALQSFSNYKNFTAPQQTDFNSLTPGSPSQVYSVSMSNDGTKYGDPLTVTLYDSLCYDCSTTPCRAKSTACLIRGYCFADSAQNPLNSHYACKIDRSTTDWTYSAAATLFVNQNIITLVFVLATMLNVIG